MRARATKLDEFQFLTCVKHGLWGSANARFKDWHIGDKLILLVGNNVAAIAEVSGPPFRSKVQVWDNGLYPHRVPIVFTHIPLPNDRPPLLGELRALFAQAFSASWGLGLVNQWLMNAEQTELIVDTIAASPSNLAMVTKTLDVKLKEARQSRDSKASKKRQSPAPAVLTDQVQQRARVEVLTEYELQISETSDDTDKASSADSSVHLRAQFALVALGKIVGCSVWVASNDRNRSHEGSLLGDGCLAKLPGMGLSAEASRAIGLIDVIWFSKNAPLYAFEVEATTSVYSGLLRMSDLVEEVPALKMDLFIVAPKSREGKVMRELARPTFRRIGLADVCRVIAIEELEDLARRVSALKGHVHPSLILTIAQGLEEEFQSALA